MNFSGPLQMVGHEVPAVVAVLCESIAGPHQLVAAKKTQPAQSNKRHCYIYLRSVYMHL